MRKIFYAKVNIDIQYKQKHLVFRISASKTILNSETFLIFVHSHKLLSISISAQFVAQYLKLPVK